MELSDYKDKYIRLFSDCIPVKGANRSAIYDFTRKEIILFNSQYFDLLNNMENIKVEILLEIIKDSENKSKILEFFDYLISNEIIFFVENINLFPKLKVNWEYPSKIQNAIIDFDKEVHDFNKIINELSVLGCQFLQLRFFSNIFTLNEINSLLKVTYNKSIEGIEIILKYENSLSDSSYIDFVETNPLISSLTIHSSVSNRVLPVNFKYKGNSEIPIERNIKFISKNIDSSLHCGIITLSLLNVPSVSSYMESRLFNGCLNRKISIDTYGNIKNCPSMSESFGNIKENSLLIVYRNSKYREKWKINKDLINVCNECEFRYICSDCRAYIENPSDLYSKPLKCGYNPYSSEWSDWSEVIEKQHAISFYKLKNIVQK
jgi:SPASM domain peptide maturase of grasp-with-spasm system